MAATNFPFIFSGLANLKNAAGNSPRINMKNDGQYNVASLFGNIAGPYTIQGYSSSVGDGGKATIDGGTNIIQIFQTASNNFLTDLIFQNNGTSGSNSGINMASATNCILTRVVVNNVRGTGFGASSASQNLFLECEAYSCNKSNTAGLGGFVFSSQNTLISCIAHDNSGNANDGFQCANGSVSINLINCIADTNGRYGFQGAWSSAGCVNILNCDFYNNGSDGILNANTTASSNTIIRNCNFIKNGGYGINSSLTTGQWFGFVDNCGFGSGTQQNTNGQTHSTDSLIVSGSVTYGTDLAPWVDPSNGDFRVNLAAAKNSGRGSFTQTQVGYSGAIGYPDIGAAQHLDSGGGSSQKAYTFGG